MWRDTDSVQGPLNQGTLGTYGLYIYLFNSRLDY